MSLTRISDYAGGLLTALDAAGRRKLARTIATQLRQSQSKRIALQQNPDGSAFVARKTQLRDRTGRIRKSVMFKKLRTATWLRARGDANTATIEFAGRAARIAAVHQFGLRDRVRPGGKEVQYAARELLGFTDADIANLKDTILTHLAL